MKTKAWVESGILLGITLLVALPGYPDWRFLLLAGLIVSGTVVRLSYQLSKLETEYSVLEKRTDYLIEQVAEKVGVEKEVQTAEIVQRLFFPSNHFEHGNLKLYGKMFTATQCAGDWWNYKLVGDHLVIGIGDATGHGVAAALMMAAVHGAYTISIKQMEESGSEVPSMQQILKHINESSRSLSVGDNSMTFLSSIIDLKHGYVTVGNASHPPPYILRRKKGDVKDIREILVPMLTPTTSALGLTEEFSIEPKRFELLPGDTLFWYTDGFLSSGKARSDGTPDRLEILRILANYVEKDFPSAEAICENAFADCLKRSSKLSEAEVDDITLVVATIPIDVKFAA